MFLFLSVKVPGILDHRGETCTYESDCGLHPTLTVDSLYNFAIDMLSVSIRLPARGPWPVARLVVRRVRAKSVCQHAALLRTAWHCACAAVVKPKPRLCIHFETVMRTEPRRMEEGKGKEKEGNRERS